MKKKHYNMSKTHEKYIISSIVFDRETKKDVIQFYGGSNKHSGCIPERHERDRINDYFVDEPEKAFLFNKESEAKVFAGEFRANTKVQKVSVTIDTSDIDTSIPIGVGVGATVSVDKGKYKVIRISSGGGRVGLERVEDGDDNK